jgi:hypothetical protein
MGCMESSEAVERERGERLIVQSRLDDALRQVSDFQRQNSELRAYIAGTERLMYSHPPSPSHAQIMNSIAWVPHRIASG